ncbi:MAG TPA: hypothetical protein VGB88_07650 [Alphaproteobacteria bacterium]
MIGFEPASVAPFAFAGAQAPVQPFEVPFGRDDDRDTISGRLAATLDRLFRHLHRHPAHRAKAVAMAAQSLSPLVDQAIRITAGSFRLQIASLSVDSNGRISAQTLAVEAQLLRIEATTPEASIVLDIAGARISETSAEIGPGGTLRQDSRTLDLSALGLSARTGDTTLDALQVIASLAQSRLALEAYRAGEASPLQRLLGEA